MDTMILSGTISNTQATEDTRVAIDDAFSLVVPKEMIFSTDAEDIGEKKLFAMYAPLPQNYLDELGGLFGEGFDAEYSASRMKLFIQPEFKQLDNVLDLTDSNTRDNYANAFINLLQQIPQKFGIECTPFVVKSDSNAVIVATDQGILGNAWIFIGLSGGYYSGMFFVAKDPEKVEEGEDTTETPEVYRKTIKQWLSTVEAVEERTAEPETKPLLVSELSFNQKNNVQVGSVSIAVPDKMIYVTKSTTAPNGERFPKKIDPGLDFICIPGEYPGGFVKYPDASVALTIYAPQTVGGLDKAWDSASLDEITEMILPQMESFYRKNERTQPLKVIRCEKGFIAAYTLLNGSDEENAFWRSYTFLMAVGDRIEYGVFYFNKKTEEKVLDEFVKNWLAQVKPVADFREIIKQHQKERLGLLAADNGTIDVILFARLFAEDVLFFPEKKRVREGGKLKTIDLQVNSLKQNDYKHILSNPQTLMSESALTELLLELDTNCELHIPTNKIHKRLLRPLLDDRLTGLSFLNLMAYHMVKITENSDEENAYFAVVDRNVMAGIPDACKYICNFIKFARQYNEKPGTFSVAFASAVNFDSPISDQLTPVPGAVTGQDMMEYTVHPDGSITTDLSKQFKKLLDKSE